MPRFYVRVAASALTRPPRHRYARHRDGVADLHVPAGDGPHPVAVVVHGGGWGTRYGRLLARPAARAIARSGWAAWNIEYGRIGRRGRGGWPQTVLDVAAAIDHLATLDDPRLDLERVIAVGHSAGGQLALWAGGRAGLPAGAPGATPRVAVRHVLGLAPVTDMRKAGAMGAGVLGGTLDEVPERFAQADPLRALPIGVPVTIVHPRDDETLAARLSEKYARAATEAGDDVEIVVPETGGHLDVALPSSAVWPTVAGRLAAIRDRLEGRA